MKIEIIFFIVLTIIIAYIFILYKVEKMAGDTPSTVDQIKDAIKQIYLADVEAIRNLSAVATKLQADGLTIPGQLKVGGKLATNNLDPANMPDGWGGGLRIFDGYSSGTMGFGPDGKKLNAYINAAGDMLGNNLTLNNNLNVKVISAQDNINVSNKSNEGGRLRILNELKNGKANQTNDWSIWNMTGDYGNKLSFWRYNGDGKNIGSALDLYDNGTVNIPGNLSANSMYIRKNNYIFFPEEATIYHNIFEPYGNSIFAKSGNPSVWDDTSYKTNPWNGRLMIRIGNGKNIYPNGVKITVPNDKNVIWLRVLNERWGCFKIFDKSGTDLGTFCGGYRKINNLSPDGGTSDGFWDLHAWISIPVPIAGEYIICSGNKVNDSGTDCWVSGLAFSTNPWNLALNSGVAYHWIVNGGTALTWVSENWNNDHVAKIPQGKITTIVVPIVPSGKDKLLYINEHNNNWDGLMHTSISCDDVVLERLRTTWDHSLARHINSKIYSRFAATIIPAKLTIGKRLINIKFDLTTTNEGINDREIGTVDLY